MVLKLWDVDNGKVKYLKHINSRNDIRLVKLKEPMECDRIPLSKLDDAIDLLFEFVSSIKKFDSVVTVNDGKDEDIKVEASEKVETRPEDSAKVRPESNVDTRQVVNIEPWIKRRVEPEKKVKDMLEEKVEVEPEKKVEKWAWGEEYDKDNGKDVPKEVNDKLSLLLQEDGGKKDGAQFLINKNARKCIDTDNSSLPLSNATTDVVIVPKEDVTVGGKPKNTEKKRYSGYEEAVIKCSQKILKDVLDSSDAKTLVNSSDLAKMMGEEFAGIDPGLLDVNVRYRFFDCGLIMTVLSNKGTDIYAGKNEKVFRFRLRTDRDKLPNSILKQRNKVNT
jgi:hypothetical protein